MKALIRTLIMLLPISLSVEVLAKGPDPVQCSFSKKYRLYGDYDLCKFNCTNNQTIDEECNHFSGRTIWACPGTRLAYNNKPQNCPTREEWKKQEKERLAKEEQTRQKRAAEDKKAKAERKKKEKDFREKYIAKNGGAFVDSRDGQKYKTIAIGDQTWMAENLNYADSNATPSLRGKTACYGNKDQNCKKYGRLYTWSAAMDSVTTNCGKDKACFVDGKLQGICPEGWRMPVLNDFEELQNFISNDSHKKEFRIDYSAQTVMATGFSQWGEASDLFGLSIKPAGFYEKKAGFNKLETATRFWGGSFTFFEQDNGIWKNNIQTPVALKVEQASNIFPYISSWSDFQFADTAYDAKYSVRCIKGQGNTLANTEIPTTMVDDSSNTYPAIRIENQVWQARNMAMNTKYSACNDNDSLCKKHGYYYDVSIVDHVCPAGWHIPTVFEWQTLFEAAKSSDENLMGKGEPGWPNARDIFNFAIPASGYMKKNYNSTEILNLGHNACFWTENHESIYQYRAVCIGVNGVNPADIEDDRDFFKLYNVRCLMDEQQNATAMEDAAKQRQAALEKSKKDRADYLEKNKDDINNCKAPKGCSFTDERDSRKYSAIAIGNQVWMSENLNYDDAEMLYTKSDLESQCPNGWRIPNKRDFDELILSAGGKKQAISILKLSQDSATALWYREANFSYYTTLEISSEAPLIQFSKYHSSASIRCIKE